MAWMEWSSLGTPLLIFGNEEMMPSMASQEVQCSMTQQEEVKNGKPNHLQETTGTFEIRIPDTDQKTRLCIDMTTSSKGGWRTMPFIFANEICEKLGAIGSGANMIMYLTQVLHMDYVQAANMLTNFGGTSSLTPLLGAFLADAYVGRFWTIAVASVIFFLGTVLLTLSATIPSLEPTPCSKLCPSPSQKELAVVIVGILLTAIGSGGIRPCVAAFGADQLLDASDSSTKNREGKTEQHDLKHPMALSTWSFFNCYFFVTGVSSLLAVTVVVYIQDNVGWGFGFGIPAALMFLSVVSFLLGMPLYFKEVPMGSPFTRLAHVLMAAFKKRRLLTTDYVGPLYELSDKESLACQQTRLMHTEQFSFLDRAAVRTPKDKTENGSLNPWQLCTVTEVEEMKILIRMAPIWASGIILITASVQQHTFSVLQARTLDRHIVSGSSFQIPPASMTVFSNITMLVIVSLYDRVLMPFAARVTGHARGMTCLQRMGVGFVVSMATTGVAAIVEVKRKKVARAAGVLDMGSLPMSVYYLVPQYCLNGMAEAFMQVGHLEFFYEQAPESMRSTAMALFWTSISAGNYLSSFLVSLIHRYTAWLPPNLNRGHLEYFYSTLTFLQVANFLIYCVSARWYKYKKFAAQETQKVEQES
ncbi:hypothetical protein GOP47_0017880 [Adiantum capillus-veneris]|uniref:Uncharacterized protein n=1 Tax=Adiantum capillus-veneris TaxID=13818 RepID=A0A9D4UGN6_ADICA|nr:hypothetical protein GOP47_0017880 [Adiantum capillus-veneris]